MNYKSTLLMPKTDFEMRGKLPTKEPAYVERWQNANMYEKVIKQNEGKEHFIFHDGPPYANGNMHVGHMLNKVIKDVICRYTLAGTTSSRPARASSYTYCLHISSKTVPM